VIYTKQPTFLGRRFVLERSPIEIGRDPDNEIVIDADSVSRKHAQLEQRKGAWWFTDLGSTNGSFVNDAQINGETRLANGDRIKIGHSILKFLSGHDIEARYHEEIYRMTIIDGLTQVFVKRYLLEALEKEIVRARRHARDLGFLMLDIDHFKKINDVHGHLAGDHVLKEVARVVQEGLRRDEVLARYGGEEFGVVLSETTLERARGLAERLRERVEQSRFVFQGAAIQVSMSIGVAVLQDSDETSLALIQRADARLYEAKRGGRNRVVS
jgi:diguanylate cyclase (GGDEF)-like protein